MKGLRWKPLALEDRLRIMEYVARDNPSAAIALDRAFEAEANRARRAPTLYRPARVKGTRELVVRPNYVIVYRVLADCVEVLRVLHAGQQWPPLADCPTLSAETTPRSGTAARTRTPAPRGA